MPVRAIAIDQTIGASRGEAVVCVLRSAGGRDYAEWLARLIRHTPANIAVVVSDEPPPQHAELAGTLERAANQGRRLFHLLTSDDDDIASLIDAAVSVAAPADVVVIDPECSVAENWFDALRQAAHADSTVATAGPLTTADLGLASAEVSHQFHRLASQVRARSPRARPRVIRPGRACVYVTRAAAELVGEVGSGWADETGESGFFAHCLSYALSHVIADDVLVSSTRHGIPPGEIQAAAPMSRSLSAARRASRGLSVVIDARILDVGGPGTQLHVMELIAALARSGRARVRAVVASTLKPQTRSALEGLPALELVRSSANAPGDIVHRPFQVSSAEDLPFLSRLGERLVVTHQDLILYRNPSYFSSYLEWEHYRRVTRRALAVADRAVFFSAHALADALSEDLVDPSRATVVPVGLDHALPRAPDRAMRPEVAAHLPERGDVIVCLGTDLRHKNRVFALRVLDQLQRRHGWDGYLVFAGPHLPLGSSADEEAELLARSSRLAERTLDVGAVDEGEKRWLLRRAAVVLYPTVYEGFGLVPFEAADQGVPCMWAPEASLAELLPAREATIVPWDARETAEQAARLLRDRAAATHLVTRVRAAGAGLTWDAAAERLIEIYGETCDRPASRAGALERMRREAAVSEDGLRLVGPGGALAPELERPVLALATHPRLGGPVLWGIKTGYRATHFVRQLRRHDERRDS